MGLIFSRRCEYALQAVLYLALKPEGEKISAQEIAGRLGIPYHFLSKIFQDLARKGMLVSLKGPSGGFGLGMPAEEITLYHIVEAIDGSSLAKDCVLGFPECSGKKPCAVHETWAGLRDEVHRMLSTKNIAEMASAMRKPEYKVPVG